MKITIGADRNQSNTAGDDSSTELIAAARCMCHPSCVSAILVDPNNAFRKNKTLLLSHLLFRVLDNGSCGAAH